MTSSGHSAVAPPAIADGATALPENSGEHDLMPVASLAEAYDEFLNHREFVRQHLHRKGIWDEAAEDLLSLIGVRYAFYRRETRIENPPAFLTTMTKHAVADYMRRHRKSDIPIGDGEDLIPLLGHERSTEDTVPDGFLNEELLLKVKSLPRRQSEVIVLIYMNGLSYEEVARTVQLTPREAAARRSLLAEQKEQLRRHGQLVDSGRALVTGALVKVITDRGWDRRDWPPLPRQSQGRWVGSPEGSWPEKLTVELPADLVAWHMQGAGSPRAARSMSSTSGASVIPLRVPTALRGPAVEPGRSPTTGVWPPRSSRRAWSGATLSSPASLRPLCGIAASTRSGSTPSWTTRVAVPHTPHGGPRESLAGPPRAVRLPSLEGVTVPVPARVGV
ncbi:sigma-70 family RNA polymerase sigma factor [Streptomyces sp. NPDC056222]|uniref:sigma-70 family RNA polymerase sigma factor n=1 Tax=Streptomyces sp. NPDC056222 TaxID=3345749 RepID=UPI0035DE5933